MIEILNKLGQPLSINLNDGSSIILLAKGKTELTSEQFKSKEVRMHLAQENILVLRMN
jgi:hypothetical protein